MAAVLFHIFADEAGFSGSAALFTAPPPRQPGHFSGKFPLLQLVQMAFENQGDGKAVANLANFVEVMRAKAQTVGFDAHVGLHHGRSGDIFRQPAFQHGVHPAERAALFGAE